MEFFLVHEGDGPPGYSPYERYHEMIAEAVFAESMGFDAYGLSEQHFLPFTAACISAPEIVMAAVAAKTTRLKLRIVSAVLLTFNHPLRVAERLATLDNISRGRAQMCTARSNNQRMMEAFGVNPAETRAQWDESLDVIAGVLTSESYEHHGKYWNFPPISLRPRPIQQPHPPLYVAATSPPTARIAGGKGIGVIIGNSLPGGFDYIQECVDTYRAAIADCTPLTKTARVNDWVGVFSASAHCAETTEKARHEAEEAAFSFTDLAIDMAGRLANLSPDYAYMAGWINKTAEHRRDLDYLINCAPYFSIGAPEFLIERFVRLADMGVNEVLLRIDAMGHEVHMRSIRMFGEAVIPEVRRRLAGRNTQARN